MIAMSSPYVHNSKKTTTDGNAAKSKNMLTVGCEIAMSRMVDASGYSQQIESQIMASLKRLTIEDKNTITANLSEDQILQLLISFAEFDWDNSGTLDSLEYESLFTSLVLLRSTKILMNLCWIWTWVRKDWATMFQIIDSKPSVPGLCRRNMPSIA